MAVQTPRSTPSIGKGPDVASASGPVNTATGLTSEEAGRRLKQFGPNAVPDTTHESVSHGTGKILAPVPWMLEAAIVLQTVLGEYVGAAIIAGLLVFNAALGFFQEGRAQATLAALKSRLALTATVRRNGVWTNLPAAELVPGDIVKLSLGAVVAADVRLAEGSVLLDQSMLTGESIPIEAGPDFQTYAGALVRRGEAVAEVTATGARTKFGRTAELVLKAHVVSSQQKAVLRVVRNLAMFNGSSDRRPGGVCLGPRHAACRNHCPRAHGGPGLDPGGAAGHFYPGGGGRRTVSGTPRRSADAPLRRGRGGIHRCPVRG